MEPGRVGAPQKRLLIRPGAIGDLIVSLPALQSLKSPYTEVWCAEQNVPLVRFADRVLSIGSSGLDRNHFDGLRGFDAIDSWYGAANEDFRKAVAAFPFRFFPAIPPAECPQNATSFYCSQVGAADALPSLETGAGAREDFVILHPFASSAAKRWPMDSFRKLAAMLPAVKWCAGPAETLDDAVRIDDLFDLARWIARARAYIGNDSGITHLAAAVGTPVVALFGPTNPVIWAPRGKNVRVLAGASLSSISPEQVFEAVRSLV